MVQLYSSNLITKLIAINYFFHNIEVHENYKKYFTFSISVNKGQEKKKDRKKTLKQIIIIMYKKRTKEDGICIHVSNMLMYKDTDIQYIHTLAQ